MPTKVKVRPAVLLLTHRMPYPPDKGDRIRTFHLLRSLSRHVRIHLATLADEPAPESSLTALRPYCERIEVVPLGPTRWVRALGSVARGRSVSEGAFDAPALRSIVRRWARETRFDAAIVSASSLAPYLRVEELRGVPALVDLVDVDSEKWLEYAASGRGPKAWLYGLEGRRIRSLEQDLARWAHALTLVSQAETELFEAKCATGPVHTITNGVDLDYFRPGPRRAENGCVFVGALDYRPNVDAAVWFCHEVWPEIHRRHPRAGFALVGRQPSREVRRLGELPGVELVGQVPDVRPYVAGASVGVVPLRLARGVQNKVLEALAMGKGVVASPSALQGLRAEPGVHLLCASSPEDWVESVSRLLVDASLRESLGASGRAYVEAEHRWERCLEPFVRLLGLAVEEAEPSASEPPAPAMVNGAAHGHSVAWN